MNTLYDLPEIIFAEKDSSVIESELIGVFENVIGRTLYPGDPMRLLLLTFAKSISLQRNLIDFSAKQNLLKYSTDGFIENIGALTGVKRLNPKLATTVLRFSLSEVQEKIVAVPRNTRATSSENKVYFATIEDAEIKPGEMSIDIKAQCNCVGDLGNGFYPGQINKLVDPLGYLCKVENITISSGGANLESLENFRQRIRISPESFSTAGPDGAYEFWSKTANQLISDVSVVSPHPGDVEIIPLLEGGELPTQDILNSVYDICNDRIRRPLTDRVTVKAPEKIQYNIELTYFIVRDNSSIGISVQNNINTAIEKYILWQKSKLGRDLNPSELTKQLVNAGAKRIEIISPIFKKLKYYEIAVVKDITVKYGGIEDD